MKFSSAVVEPIVWRDSVPAGAGMLSTSNGKVLLYQDFQCLRNASSDSIFVGFKHSFNQPSAVFFRKPGSSDSVFQFTVNSYPRPQTDLLGGEGDAAMSRISLSGSNGRGSILRYSDTIAMASNWRRDSTRWQASASYVVTPSTNGRDAWLIVPSLWPHGMRVYRFTESGLQIHQKFMMPEYPRAWQTVYAERPEYTELGEVKVSPDGRHVVLCAGVRGRVLYLDFDPSLGQLSNARQLAEPALFIDDSISARPPTYIDSIVVPYGGRNGAKYPF